jgi:hypothetical protein
MSIIRKFGDSPHVLAVSFLSLSTALACNVVDTTSDVAKAGVSKTVRVASYDELGLGGTKPTPEECDALFADSNGTDFESPREDPEGESGSGLMAPGGGAPKKKSKTIGQRVWEYCFGTKEDPENPSAGGPTPENPGTNGPTTKERVVDDYWGDPKNHPPDGPATNNPPTGGPGTKDPPDGTGPNNPPTGGPGTKDPPTERPETNPPMGPERPRCSATSGKECGGGFVGSMCRKDFSWGDVDTTEYNPIVGKCVARLAGDTYICRCVPNLRNNY